MKSPLLSICIPTYNRCEVLKLTLQSIVVQKSFSESTEVEIIVCDNNSNDDTESIVQEISRTFPGKIRYHKNSYNIGEENFYKVLTLGRGEYLKLYNDYVFLNPDALDQILKLVHENIDEKPFIFFSNGLLKNLPEIEFFNDLNGFVNSASYSITWISGFGIWREAFEKTEDFLRGMKIHLIQSEILLRLISKGGQSIVVNKPMFKVIDHGKKSGYNIIEVFGVNFIQLLKNYCEQGLLHPDVVRKVTKDVFENHIFPSFFDFNNDLDKSNILKYMKEFFDEEYLSSAFDRLLLDLSNTIKNLTFSLESSHQQFYQTLKNLDDADIVKIVAGSRFDETRYLRANPDVSLARLNPIIHYVVYGIRESRFW